MKTVNSFLTFFFVICFSCSANTKQTTQDNLGRLRVDTSKIKWKLYRSEEHKFEVLYPDNWVKLDGILDTTFLSTRREHPFKKLENPFFSISFSHNTPYEPKMKPARGALTSQCKQPDGDEEPFLQEEVHLSGIKAYIKSCRRYGQKYLRVATLFEMKSQKNFVISAYEEPEDKAPKVRGVSNKDFKNWYYYPIYKKMIESFKYFGEAPERIKN